jgi:hypothetical protein
MSRAVIATMMMVFFLFSRSDAENEYWDNGKIRVEEEYGPVGEIARKTYYDQDGNKERQERYNDRGQKIVLVYFDRHGALKPGADGWAAMKWKYDDGNMIGEAYYASDGKLQEYKKYNKEGDLVDKKYFGGQDPDPNEEYGTPPTLAGETIEYYDKYGKKEGSTGITYDEPFFPYTFLWDE